MTNNIKGVIEAVKRGYTIDKEGIVRNPSGKIVLGSFDSKGYKKFSIRHGVRSENGHYHVYHHKLQAYSVYGEKAFNDGVIIHHKNRDLFDNSVENLELTTRKKAAMNIPKAERVMYARNASSYAKRKIDAKTWVEIKKKHKSGIGYKKLSKEYGVSLSTLSYNLSKKAKKVKH